MKLNLTKKQKKIVLRPIAATALIVAIRFLPVSGVPKLLLCLIPYLIAGDDILWKAFHGIGHGQLFDENFLMAIATVGAFALALYEGSADCNEAIAVMLFYQIGEFFQSYAVGKSRRNITELMDLRPDYANIEQDGELVQADPDEIAIGSIIVVQPGEKFPWTALWWREIPLWTPLP